MVPVSVWYRGAAVINTELTSYDGVTYFYEKRRILSSSYYFLKDERLEHSRSVYTLLALGSEIGGLGEVIFIITGIFIS